MTRNYSAYWICTRNDEWFLAGRFLHGRFLHGRFIVGQITARANPDRANPNRVIFSHGEYERAIFCGRMVQQRPIKQQKTPYWSNATPRTPSLAGMPSSLMIQIFKRPRMGRRGRGGCVWPKCFWNLTWSWFVLKTSWCHFTFNAFHFFFKSPASKHRVRDEILHGLVVHMVPYQKSVSKSVFLNKNRSQKSALLIKIGLKNQSSLTKIGLKICLP